MSQNKIGKSRQAKVRGSSVASDDAMAEVLAVGIALGKLESVGFVAVAANTYLLEIYEIVKKTRAWRFLNNPHSGRNGHFESLEEFCEVKLGKSYKRIQGISSNRNLIGQEAFEQAERLGLQQRDYNAIKSLPAPDQELVRRAVMEAQSRAEVLGLLLELGRKRAEEMRRALTHVPPSMGLCDSSPCSDLEGRKPP